MVSLVNRLSSGWAATNNTDDSMTGLLDGKHAFITGVTVPVNGGFGAY